MIPPLLLRLGEGVYSILLLLYQVLYLLIFLQILRSSAKLPESTPLQMAGLVVLLNLCSVSAHPLLSLSLVSGLTRFLR